MNQPTNMTPYEICLNHSRADRNIRLLAAKVLEKYGITMMEWLLLATVYEGDAKKGKSMTELARALDVTLPQITALTSGLTASKLVRQRISAADRRSRRLMGTPQSRDIMDNIEKDLNKAMKEWLSDIPAGDLVAYQRVITALANKK